VSAHYLVTGGAGFIGSNIVRALVERAEKVRIIDNLSTGKIENIADILNHVEFINGDIRYIHTVMEQMKGIDYVLHQAALPSVPRSIEIPLESNDNNTNGTLNILIAAQKNKVKRVVYAGSSSAYGDSPSLPKVETMNPNPLSPYAVNKLTGEYYCTVFSRVYGLETVVLRYFNVFGPRQDPTSYYSAVIPKFIKAISDQKSPTIFGDGEQSRDFSYIENVVEANLLACHAENVSGEVFNIACGERLSVNDLFSYLGEILKSDLNAEYLPPRTGDVKHSLANISKAQKMLGYQIKVPVKEGLHKTVEWFSNLNKSG
jgi:nucleoside-diphosphate-sugar epimerase